MSESFFNNPVLNSPYEVPTRHHALDKEGQPRELPPVAGRRSSELITPVPKPRKKRQTAATDQARMVLDAGDDLSSEEQEYNPTPIINRIRTHIEGWRALKSQADWGVTPATARLLAHWRHHTFEDVRPFFCQVEAVETIIWLTEVAPKEQEAVRTDLGACSRSQRASKPGVGSTCHEDGYGQRQDHGHGHAHCLANSQRGALAD